jgi:hypothetical protein
MRSLAVSEKFWQGGEPQPDNREIGVRKAIMLRLSLVLCLGMFRMSSEDWAHFSMG